MQANHTMRHRCFVCFHVCTPKFDEELMQSEKETRSEETLMHIGSHAGSEENRNGNAETFRGPAKTLP